MCRSFCVASASCYQTTRIQICGRRRWAACMWATVSGFCKCDVCSYSRECGDGCCCRCGCGSVGMIVVVGVDVGVGVWGWLLV